jgi:L-amino acid N-acyltransferase YncA
LKKIRLADEKDAEGILDIYAPYIKSTSFTFETEVPTVKAFAERISTYLIDWPWLVCEVDGIIAGYAYATRYRERTAYHWCTESSVYIHDDYQRAGIAQALYYVLFEILKKQGFRNVYAVINLPNDKSVAFHESCGFKYFATYEQVGYKLGKWKNVGWWRLILNEFDDEPAAPVKFSESDKSFLPGLFTEQVNKVKFQQ